MSSRYRLPRTVVPSHYDLTIEPDLDRATFAGQVRVDVEVREPVVEIVLNAAELDISRARLTDPTGNTVDLAVEHDRDAERVVLGSANRLDIGRATLDLSFTGILNDHLRGFYRSTFTDEEGEIQTIGVTQFEATDARRAFPCWDEPDLKATFDVTLEIEPGLLAVANTRPVVDEPTPSGKRRIRFERSIEMSTYLVAFVVGPLEATEPRDIDGVPLRVIHQPGKGDSTEYALDAAEFALRYLSEYYKIPYPGGKLDLIALPDFAWGAMENIGAITFRENLLIIDPDHASHAERLRITDVIAHEVAHMWFGDLVTMRWWNGVWLNEAFATFMELKTTDAARPDWHRWTAFGIEAGMAKEIDALASTRPIEFEVDSPDDANEMFDALTYLKGSSVLRMLEQFIGEDEFCEGVADYLQTHAYANTETDDLWAALEGSSGRPVARIMGTWIHQGGFPVVRVSGDSGDYRLEQAAFTLLPEAADGRHWQIPVAVRSLASGEERHVLLGSEPASVGLDGPLWVNSNGHGFYVVQYDTNLAEAVVAHYGDLAPLERFLLIDDLWSLTLAGSSDLKAFLGLLGVLRNETEPSVWQAALGALGEVDRFVGDEDRAAFRRYCRTLVEPALSRLGWEPAADEPDLSRKVRATLIEAMGRLVEAAGAVAECRRIVERDDDGVDQDVVAAAIGVVAWHGTVEEYARFVDRYENPATPQERVRYLFALPSFPEPELAARTVEMIVDGRIRNQDGPYILAGLLRNRRVNEFTWRLLEENWDEIGKVLPERTSRRVLFGIPALTQPGLAEDVRRWLADHPTSHTKTEAQRLELLEVYRRFRERERPRLSVALDA